MATRSPTFTSPNGHHFLGFDLCHEQFRAAIVDGHLSTVGVEIVDFDSELPEYQTRSGLFNAPGDIPTVPIEMWIRGLDRLLEKLRARFDLSKIRTIGGCAQSCVVWWRHESASQLVSISGSKPLHEQINSSAFSIHYVPIPQDTSTQSQSLTLEATLGAPGANTAAHLTLPATQIMNVREGQPNVWSSTARIMLASAFLATLLAGKWCRMSESDVVGTGIWNFQAKTWDEASLDLLAGGKEEASRLREMLGDVERSGGAEVGLISPYFVERYGLRSDVTISPFISDSLSAYLSISPSPNDIVMSFGTTDVLMASARKYVPSRLYHLHPHPAQTPQEEPRFIATLVSRNADTPRASVRDLYTKSWSAFDRLVSVIPPGGSIGLDDKVFSFWILQGESFPFAHVKGVYRFEMGVKVNEFRDLRTNPRTLMESQILSFRVRYSRMASQGLFSDVEPAQPPPIQTGSFASLGVSFDPYDYSTLPRRVITIGSAANFPSVVNLMGDVFNARVFVPLSDQMVANAGPKAKPAGSSSGSTTPGGVFGAAIAPTVTAAAMTAAMTAAATATHLPPGTVPAPSRASAALGAAYMARWAWRCKTRPDEQFGSFEEEVHYLLRRGRGTPSGQSKTSSSHGHFSPSRSPSGTSTPIPHRSPSGLAVASYPDDGEMPQGNSPSHEQRPAHGLNLSPGALTFPASSLTANSPVPAPTALSAPLSSNPVTLSLPPMMTDLSDIEVGLVKVSEPDPDTFLTYAALIPEYCRLEGMLVRNLV
ncbi:uncharacterized protein EI90DRAFT_3125091 [Cantharellus anzutake]|uniref:uncharacterized protein n=1 Tax=Cantharellus anzutake TaxID=1750568 RepID=UPI001908A15A|nr:uncharacterized protein EI90DRAFT_3125091 [Cantharellus anzutake]KAF8329836.1 hypothetical protein EI90DRAFT_3125091 [Cantharellus anzutake]